MKVSLAQSRNKHRARLCEFHLEEAAFLYEQRQVLQQDCNVSWIESEAVEKRIDRHLNALMVHDKVAFDLCAEHALTGIGELYVALRMFGLHNNWSRALAMCTNVDLQETGIKRAVVDALLLNTTASWVNRLTALLRNAEPVLQQIAATVLGSKRQAASGLLLRAMQDHEPINCVEFIWALGRCGQQSDAEVLHDYLYLDDNKIAETAAIAMLRLGSKLPEQVAARKASEMHWPAHTLALAQTESGIQALVTMVKEKPTVENIRALGICGVPAVDLLLSLLDDRQLASASAQALHMITGAGLHEEVWVADTVAKEEMFEDELVKHEQDGTLPTRTDGLPFGQAEVRTSQNRKSWETWFERHAFKFNDGVRYRYGLPVSKAQTLCALFDETQSIPVRQTVAHELVIHYQADNAFEAHWPVTWQQKSLERMRSECHG